MASSAHTLATKLAPVESTDPVVQTVAKNVRTILEDLGINKQVPGLQVYFPDFANADFGPVKPVYYTTGCLSVLPSTVIVNARFLLDTEAAIRSFGLCDVLLNTPYLRNDACMFGLVKRIREDGEGWLKKLRELEDGQKSDERHAVDELTLTALFFCAHEIGHLKDGVNAGQYAAFLDPRKPLETRLANAAVKLRRHASEFEAYGFDLPGWQAVVKPEHEVFAAAEKLRKPIAGEDEDNAEWFKKEISADDAAVELMIRYLKDLPARYRWLLIRGLFAAGMHAWYKDLLAFCEQMDVPRMGAKPMLSFELMKDPQAYISAASLFGDVHRCTILRSALAIQEILNEQEKDEGVASGAKSGGSLLDRAASLWSRLFEAGPTPDDPREQHRKSQSAQRHLLLAIHMDTVVKLAYVGASMPWMAEKKAQRGSEPLLLMEFEAIDQSVARLKEMMGLD